MLPVLPASPPSTGCKHAKTLGDADFSRVLLVFAGCPVDNASTFRQPASDGSATGKAGVLLAVYLLAESTHPAIAFRTPLGFRGGRADERHTTNRQLIQLHSFTNKRQASFSGLESGHANGFAVRPPGLGSGGEEFSSQALGSPA